MLYIIIFYFLIDYITECEKVKNHPCKLNANTSDSKCNSVQGNMEFYKWLSIQMPATNSIRERWTST